ncbi:hypothetical protein XENOCAPTIV_022297, partial [Xenoophorus captivus]
AKQKFLSVRKQEHIKDGRSVAVIVAESDSFEFVFPDNNAVSMASIRHVYIESEGGATILIPIWPLVLGEIPISVKAMSFAASDFIRTTVLVKVLRDNQLLPGGKHIK